MSTSVPQKAEFVQCQCGRWYASNEVPPICTACDRVLTTEPAVTARDYPCYRCGKPDQDKAMRNGTPCSACGAL